MRGTQYNPVAAKKAKDAASGRATNAAAFKTGRPFVPNDASGFGGMNVVPGTKLARAQKTLNREIPKAHNRGEAMMKSATEARRKAYDSGQDNTLGGFVDRGIQDVFKYLKIK